MSYAQFILFTSVLGTIAEAQEAPTGGQPGGPLGRAPGGSPGGPPPGAPSPADLISLKFSSYLLFACIGSVGFFAILRIGNGYAKYLRKLLCLNNDTQRYFAAPTRVFAFLKKNITYAPIFRKRHNQAFQLSTAITIGTLPTRLQTLFLAAYFGTNVALCVLNIDFDESYGAVAAQLRIRTGTLALANMTPLFLLSGRNNPLIILLNFSFDTFNLLHRWIGRIVILLAIAHASCYSASRVKLAGWNSLLEAITNNEMITYGFIAIVTFLVISIQAASALRHAFYETFKSLHSALVILVIITAWHHVKLAHTPQISLLETAIISWVVDHVIRTVRIVLINVGKGGTRAFVEALPGNACRVTLDLARPWTFKPGQHVYLYIPAIGLWTSHPFSVAWSQEAEQLDDEKLAMNQQDIIIMQKTKMSFVIRARTGFTRKLYEKAASSPANTFNARCFAEGPYGGMHSMHSYGTVMLFAGGIGITHQVPYVRDLVAGFANGSVAARKIVLVWVIQSPEHLEWIRPWMTSILAMDRRRDVLRIMLYISQPTSTKEISSPSTTVQMFLGRPNIGALIDSEVENKLGAIGVSVCGSGGLSDDVRLAVCNRQFSGNIDFVEEAFSW